MNFCIIVMLAFCVFGTGSAYIFPITTGFTEQSLTYLSNLKFPFVYYSSNNAENPENGESPSRPLTDVFSENLSNIFALSRTLFTDFVLISFLESYKLASNNLPILKDQFFYCLQFLPIFKKEEKVRADSKLYLLFIVTSLAIYMVGSLYLFFKETVLLLPKPSEGAIYKQRKKSL